MKKKPFAELLDGLTKDDLRKLTISMVDAKLANLAGCIDADVVFLPHAPNAHDENDIDPGEANLVWQLDRVIVHTTATTEKTAFLAAELARSVANHGRSRYETPC